MAAISALDHPVPTTSDCHFGFGGHSRYRVVTMSKRTNKKKINARKKKANHGRKPNAGRNS